MSIPKLPVFYDMVYTMKETGRLTSEAQLFNDQAYQSLNLVVNMFNEGVTMPSFTTAEIVALEPDAGLGTIWFNTSLAKLQVKTATGVIETITSV